MIAHSFILDDTGGWSVVITQDDIPKNLQGTITISAGELLSIANALRQQIRPNEPCDECGSTDRYAMTEGCCGCGAIMGCN